MPQPKIVVVGSSNTDMVIASAALPRPGETLLGGEFMLAAGGKGANQAVAAARAGGRVTFVACVGDDLFGKAALAGFARERIDTRFVRVVKGGASGVALILVDSRGENLISVAPGANAKLTPKDVDRAASAIRGADCLLAQLEVPVETVKRALQIARKAGVLTILNPAPARKLPKDLLRLVDVLTPNRTEIAGVLGRKTADARQAAAALRKLGVQCVILTRGSQGALLMADAVTPVPAFRVKPVDAVAAGDVFSGAFAVARTEGKPLVDSVRFACAAAAISVTRKGAQPSVPNRREIDAFLAGRTQEFTAKDAKDAKGRNIKRNEG